MCGIAGFFGFEDKTLIKKMLDRIVYRGPDDSGIYIDKNICLGNRRLSIIDVAGGKQPIHNEDETIWTVYNGEIYNYLNLKKELEEAGHKFYTQSDTEVLVHAYEQWGKDFVKKLRGIFAFAIYDTKNKKLILGRDEAGVKPLYYTLLKNSIIFGSEIKCILEHKEVKKMINKNALDCYFTFNSVLGDETLFEGIKKLPPAHILVHDGKKLKIERYWRYQLELEEISPSVAEKRILELIKDGIKSQLMSEVPLGAFLSGGIDSSTVVGIMSKMLDKPVKTFTVGFRQENDELEYAKIAAEEFGTDHHEIFVEDSDVIKILPTLAYHFDDLSADAAMVPTYLVSKFAKKYVTVVLTGEGGDEIFAGYNRYKPFSDLLFFVPKQIKMSIFKNAMTVFDKDSKDKLYSEQFLDNTKNINNYSFLDYYFNNKNNLNSALLFGFEEILPNQLLAKVDKTTMANSIEARVPLLDKYLVEYSGRINSNMKMRFLNNKYIFKKAVSPIVPEIIRKRKKHGFVSPISKWFKEELGDYAIETLSQNGLIDNYVKKEYVEDLLKKVKSGGNRKEVNKIWALLMFKLWLDKYFN